MNIGRAKFLTVVWLLILSFTVLGQTNASGTSDTVILEIVTRGVGMVYPSKGVLDFRLFKSGRAEYELVPGIETNDGRRGDLLKKTAELTDSQVREIVELASNKDFLEAKKRYPSIRRHVDDYWFTTVKFKHGTVDKEFIVTNFWDVLDYPEDRERYPSSVVRILELTNQITGKWRTDNR